MFTAVAAFSFAHPAKANLITNPGFETGDFTGWTTSGFAVVSGTFFNLAPHSGNFQANLGNPLVNGSITQTLATMAGQSYTIDFWLALPPGQPLNPFNSFVVTWGGVTILNLHNFAGFAYTEYTFTETAASASTALHFEGSNPNLFGFSGWALDDVSVNVPDGGTTVSLLGFGLLGLAALRRKLGC